MKEQSSQCVGEGMEGGKRENEDGEKRGLREKGIDKHGDKHKLIN